MNSNEDSSVSEDSHNNKTEEGYDVVACTVTFIFVIINEFYVIVYFYMFFYFAVMTNLVANFI